MKKEVRNLVALGLVVVVVAVIATMLYRQSNQPVQTVSKDEISEALIRPDSPTLGPADAKVTIVEFLDPECESCAAFAPIIKRVLKEFDGRVRLVIRYMPLHRNARLAVAYTEAAGEQGKYWEMQEKLFQNQSQWGEIHGHGPQPVRPEPQVLFDKWAGELGLNVEQLKASAGEKRHLDKAERDLADGRSLGVRATPTIFVNGRRLTRLNENDLRSMINMELSK